jgi:pyruvate/2-oxoglutarate dehydrogenase complex dihydrolipoamide acyltransferase (E2) component
MSTRWPSIGALALLLLLGCGDGSDHRPATTSPPPTHAGPPSSSTTTIPAAAAPPATIAAPATAEDGRRILEQHGIDPDRLSQDIAEQMRRRFEPRPAE